MLYQSTCVGLGYGLYAGAVSWNVFAAIRLHERMTTYDLRHHPQAGDY
jgi:hypothetical protein